MNPLRTTAVDEQVVRLTLHRPDQRNALSIDLRDRLSDELDRLATDESTKVVVITGAGSTFSAGFDLTEFDRAEADPALERRLWASSDRFHHTVLRCPLVLIAAVNGPAVAAGFDLATMCDLRVLTEEAYFERPEVGFTTALYGVLHDLIGGAAARELTLTGRRVDATEARQLGLATQVVSPEQLEDEVLQLAHRICRTPRADLRRVKRKIVSRHGLAGRPTLEI